MQILNGFLVELLDTAILPVGQVALHEEIWMKYSVLR